MTFSHPAKGAAAVLDIKVGAKTLLERRRHGIGRKGERGRAFHFNISRPVSQEGSRGKDGSTLGQWVKHFPSFFTPDMPK